MFEHAISLYEPLNVYKPLTHDIGTVDGPIVCMSYPGMSWIKIPFPTRMTVVQLPSGELWLHSPTAFDANLANHLAAMGPIRHLVSPNKLHYSHIGEWKKAFPDAITWASPGVRERACSQRIEIDFDQDLDAVSSFPWQDTFRQTVIRGSFMEEVVFFHQASRTLILADGIENFELDKIRQPYRMLVRASGVFHPHGQMPLDLRLTFRRNKPALRTTIDEILSWHPERIIVGHGRCIETGAKDALRFAFRWAY